MSKDQCRAFTYAGNRCIFAARHQHSTPGDAIKVCQRHYDMLRRLHREGGDEQVVRSWISRA